MSKIEALKELGYNYITKNKYISKKPHYDYVMAWIYKPEMINKEDLCDDELINWTNGEECGYENWKFWTQIKIQNSSDFNCVDENASEPYVIK